jgi:hypothetical protein
VKHNINEADNMTSPGIPVLGIYSLHAACVQIFIYLLEQYYEIMLKNENLIRSKLESLVVELNEEKQKLNQFMMMNRSIAEELTNANCIGLANDKNLMYGINFT